MFLRILTENTGQFETSVFFFFKFMITIFGFNKKYTCS